MAAFYDARGNIYGVVTPAALRGLGIALPGSPTAHREAETAKAHRG